MNLTCRELIEFLMDYLDGELPSEQQSAFQQHLDCCCDCVQFLKTYQATVDLEKKSLCTCEDEIPASVPEELVQAILAARAARPLQNPG